MISPVPLGPPPVAGAGAAGAGTTGATEGTATGTETLGIAARTGGGVGTAGGGGGAEEEAAAAAVEVGLEYVKLDGNSKKAAFLTDAVPVGLCPA